MRRLQAVLAAALLAGAALPSLADDAKPDAATQPPAVTPFVKLGNVAFFRSYEDAFSRARREGKLVVVYRMLGEMDGLT